MTGHTAILVIGDYYCMLGEFTFKGLCIVVIGAIVFFAVKAIKAFYPDVPSISERVSTLINAMSTAGRTISLSDAYLETTFDTETGAVLSISVDYHIKGYGNTDLVECILFFDSHGNPLIDNVNSEWNTASKKGGQVAAIGVFHITNQDESGTLRIDFPLKELHSSEDVYSFNIMIGDATGGERLHKDNVLYESCTYEVTLKNKQ